jgi:hypothetical protein
MHSSTVSSTTAVHGLARFIKRTAVASAIGAGMLLAASSAAAQIIYSGPVNLTIPVSTNGLYLNVVTGANNLPPPGTGGLTVPGWDINPWSSTGLAFFNPASPAGGVYVVTAPGFVANLAPGASIGAGGLFGSGTGTNTAQWNLNSDDNVFGFRFFNEASGTVHYGWARLSLGASPIDPARMLTEYAFEATPGLAIQAGVVPEPGTYALMGLGLAGVALWARRRRVS